LELLQMAKENDIEGGDDCPLYRCEVKALSYAIEKIKENEELKKEIVDREDTEQSLSKMVCELQTLKDRISAEKIAEIIADSIPLLVLDGRDDLRHRIAKDIVKYLKGGEYGSK